MDYFRAPKRKVADVMQSFHNAAQQLERVETEHRDASAYHRNAAMLANANAIEAEQEANLARNVAAKMREMLGAQPEASV